MVTSILGIISGIIGIVALLLKYYPGWRAKRDAQKDQEDIRDFGDALASGDDARVSLLLDAEYSRVHGQKGGGNL